MNFNVIFSILMILSHHESKNHQIHKRDKFDWLEYFTPVQEPVSEIYDFIIVGSGSSGSVIANRLSKNFHWKILLLEAGDKENLVSQVPLLLYNLQFTKYNWGYYMQHQSNMCLGCENKFMPWHQGKALGGSTVIGYMKYARGNCFDYDKWAEAGNPGWSCNKVLPYFLKSENVRLKYFDPRYHGVGGYLTIEDAYQSKITSAFIKGMNELDYPIIDINGGRSLGVSTLQATTTKGRRLSVAKAFLDPIKLRRNLKIITKAFVTRLLINHRTKQAYGVEYERLGKTFKVGASREVILSAGVFGSPKLLMLAGIGPKKHLQELGIHVLKDLAVGENLQDHFAYLGLTFTTKEPLTLHSTKLLNPLVYQQFTRGSGPLTSLGGFEATAYIKTGISRESDPIPDAELLFAGASLALDFGIFARSGLNINNKVYQKMFAPLELKYSFMIIPVLLHPISKGLLRLQSTDPYDNPLLYGNYLTDRNKDDMDTLLAAIRFVQTLSRTESFYKFNVTMNDIPVPGCEHHKFDSEPYWRCCMTILGQTINEHVGTVKMGPSEDPEAVVSHELKVHGIGRLRVADASIIPSITSGNTGAAAIMIGEKVSDLIRSDWK